MDHLLGDLRAVTPMKNLGESHDVGSGTLKTDDWAEIIKREVEPVKETVVLNTHKYNRIFN